MNTQDNKSMSPAASAAYSELAVPALQIQLSGNYLIEASAGTGKTWTLTGIVLRLLIEGKRNPEQIIATTFTRAAAAEMRERIHGRLASFYQLVQWLQSLHQQPSHLSMLYLAADDGNPDARGNHPDNDSSKSQPQDNAPDRSGWLLAQAQLAGLADEAADPINLHLLNYLLDNTASYPLSDAIRRCAVALATLDKLFVSTLDSLAQKWLSEYSAETGYSVGMQISSNDEQQSVIDAIIHDEIRRFHSQLYAQQPTLYQLLSQANQLTCVADHHAAVTKALNFFSTPVDAVVLPDFDLQALSECITNILTADDSELIRMVDKGYRSELGVSGASGSYINSYMDLWSSICDILQTEGKFVLIQLSDKQRKLLQGFRSAQISYEQGGRQFKKAFESQRQAFAGLPIVQHLGDLAQLLAEYELLQTRLTAYLNRRIVLAVREKLADTLEEQSQTTFTLQMLRLNQALSGQQGANLARYIRHHYPVALIDESQDINGEQAQMIQHIYLPKHPSHQPPQPSSQSSKRGFLLLVGDPKQAIYRFRGGDVANYNQVKRRFADSQIYSLDTNRRSNAALIQALNHWFDRVESEHDPDSDETDIKLSSDLDGEDHRLDHAHLGAGIYYHHIQSFRKFGSLSWHQALQSPEAQSTGSNEVQAEKIKDQQTAAWQHWGRPVSILHLPYQDEQGEDIDSAEQVAAHITQLLSSQQTLAGNPIQPSDIAVLATKKSDLAAVQDALDERGIASIATMESSIFASAMATDLLLVLQAVMSPYRRDLLHRVLSSHWYGFSIEQLQDLTSTTDDVSGSTVVSNTHAQEAASELEAAPSLYQLLTQQLKTAAERWQYEGVLACLHFLLTQLQLSDGSAAPSQPDKPACQNPTCQPALTRHRIPKHNVWQHLAGYNHRANNDDNNSGKNSASSGVSNTGERYLLDLRQLLDTIAEHAAHLGEYELLDWLQQHIREQPVDDWAKQLPLPSDCGVHMLTIHKSKGLEFSIVYVLGMDAAASKANQSDLPLYLYEHGVDSVTQTLSDNHSNRDRDKNTNTASNKQTQHTIPKASDWQRRLSALAGNEHDASYYADMEQQALVEEKKRLGYVAFTRASEQLYVVLQDHRNKANIQQMPANIWLECDDKDYRLPERLHTQVSWLELIPAHASSHLQALPAGESALPVASEDAQPTQSVPTQRLLCYPDYQQVMRQRYFQGWEKTSFTALAQLIQSPTLPADPDAVPAISSTQLSLLDDDHNSMAVQLPDYIMEDTVQLSELPVAEVHHSSIDPIDIIGNGSTKDGMAQDTVAKKKVTEDEVAEDKVAGDKVAEDDIRFSFVRGAGAGSFLHKVLEKIDFSSQQHWSEVIDHGIREFNLPSQYASEQRQLYQHRHEQGHQAYQLSQGKASIDTTQHQALLTWLHDILHVRLLASGQRLGDIPARARFAEMGFNMSVTEQFRPEQISELFADHFADAKDKLILLSSERQHLYRYLRGEIDLVYEHGGRYFVVDYKSNYLGNSLSNYDQSHLQHAMSKAGYWLQACIYQVALHRYLRLRIADYTGNEDRHLGAVEYVFLRGIAPFGSDTQGEGEQRLGRICWQVPASFVLALDALLGQASSSSQSRLARSTRTDNPH